MSHGQFESWNYMKAQPFSQIHVWLKQLDRSADTTNIHSHLLSSYRLTPELSSMLCWIIKINLISIQRISYMTMTTVLVFRHSPETNTVNCWPPQSRWLLLLDRTAVFGGSSYSFALTWILGCSERNCSPSAVLQPQITTTFTVVIDKSTSSFVLYTCGFLKGPSLGHLFSHCTFPIVYMSTNSQTILELLRNVFNTLRMSRAVCHKSFKNWTVTKLKL